jgi:site-specific recombinase XerD
MPCSIRFEKPYMVEVIGKGAKKRFVYLNEMVIDSLSVYMKQYQLQTVEKVQHPLFFNSRGEKLTNAGITYILQKYAISANKISPELVECKPTPHWLRHSRAEHLLQKGYPIVAIPNLLLVPPDLEKIKEEAMIQLSETLNPKSNKKGNWETNEKLKSYLKGLIK